jgi:hypothetical protein
LQLPTTERLKSLQAALLTSPAGQLTMALLSRHFDQVRDIINRSRKAAAIWHRVHGPQLLRMALSWPGGSRPLLPATLGGLSVSDGLDRLLRVVGRFANAALDEDIRRYRRFVLALPGARLGDVHVEGR